MFSKIIQVFLIFVLSSAWLFGCSQNSGEVPVTAKQPDPLPNAFWAEKFSGGTATSLDLAPTSHSFSYPVPTLSGAELALHNQGDILFSQHFTEDQLRFESGLGPVYNNSSCIGCHNRDGRGSLPAGLSDSAWVKMSNTEALLLRISIEDESSTISEFTAANNYGEPIAVPGYSHQLFQAGSYGLRGATSSDGQAEVWVKLEKSKFIYPDGETIILSKPIFELRNPYDLYVDPKDKKEKSRLWQKDVRISPRMGMPMFGLGLLESIPEAAILHQASVDYTSEGVNGIVNYVYDAVKAQNGDSKPVSLGRFGLKANTPNLLHQSMAALNGDIGVTNPLFPVENIFGTKLFDTYKNQNPSPLRIEAGEELMHALTFYTQTLAVPGRRDIDNPEVIEGAKIFSQISCTSCHTPSWETDASSPIAAYRNQKIFPYSDLLLHDMGQGLADDRRDFRANGRQWKTRALWGIGLTKVVNPRAGFLHDGRAASFEEAILWHDGESRYSKMQFTQLSKSDRLKLFKFLQSL